MKLIILDRDGVLNYESPDFIKSPDECIPLPGSLEAVAELTKAGYTVVIATNQSGVGRGYFTLDTLDAINNKLSTAAEKLGGKIDKFYFCPHLPNAGCNCRKPKTGMFEQIAQDFNIDLNVLQPVYVGDSLRDIEAGLAVGCRFFLVTGPGSDGEETLQKITAEQRAQIMIVDDLADAVSRMLYA